MTDKQRAAMEQALDQLQSVLCDPEGNVCWQGSYADRDIIGDALDVFRAALAEPAEQKPDAHIGWLVRDAYGRLDLLTDLQIESSLSKYERLRKLYTAPQPAIPAGYKLVPVEPTPEMKNVQTWDYRAFRPASEIWADMLAAAPEAPQPAKREPLTVQQINEIEQYGEFWENHTPLDFARAIEAAHGITKE